MEALANKICVRLCDKEGMFRAGYYTSNLSETLKMYTYMKDNGIALWYNDTECYIEEVSVLFGNDDNLLSIDLNCEILGEEKE